MSQKAPSRHEPFYHRFGLVSPVKSQIGPSADGSHGTQSNSVAPERLQESAEVADAAEDVAQGSCCDFRMASLSEDECGLSNNLLGREESSEGGSHPLISGHSPVCQNNEDADLVEKCQTEELAIIETAVLRLLQKEKAQLPTEASDSSAAQPGEQAVQDVLRDKSLLLGLLQEVRSFRNERNLRQTQVPECDESRQLQESADRFEKPEQEALPPQPEQNLKEVVEAAAHAAVAAAEAAKAAAASVKQNSTAIETLVKSLNGVPSTQTNVQSAERVEVDVSSHPDVEKASESQASGDPKVVELAKVVCKQNRLTHWLLGFMVVTTAVWRFKTVSVVMKLQKKVSKPVESLQSMFGGDKDESSNPPKLPGFQEIATLLQGDPETGKPGLFSGPTHAEDEGPVGQKFNRRFPIRRLFPHHD